MGAQDPALQIDPQLLEAGRRYLESAPRFDQIGELPVTEVRARIRAARAPWNTGGPVMAASADVVLPGPHRPIPVRIHRPTATASGPVTVFLHGGGFVLGDLDTHDRILRELAAASGGPVVGVDYALGPEHPYPAAFDEVTAAVVHLMQHGEALGVGDGRLVLAGDSAGARLALAACLDPALRDSDRIGACLLYYGSYGLTDSASRRLYAGGAFGFGEHEMAFFRRHYPTPDETDPRLDPLSADLAGLPPLFIAAAELDPLRDDSLALHWRVRAAGGRSWLTIATDLPHGYLLFVGAVEAAFSSLQSGGDFIRACR